jgi:hypothetical protein
LANPLKYKNRNMKTIHLFAALSIDGIDVPANSDCSFIESHLNLFYRNAKAILAEKEDIPLLVNYCNNSSTTKIYVIEKDTPSLRCRVYSKGLPGKVLYPLSKLQKGTTGYIAVARNNTKLITGLLEKNLVDKMDIYIHPVLEGKGNRFFSTQTACSRWKVRRWGMDTESGIIMLHYTKE